MSADAAVVLEAAALSLDVDTALMLRFQAGEDGCFDELVARFRRPLMGFVFRMVHDSAAAEELLQEAFLRVYLHRQRYKPQARFSTWMYRIAHRLALNYLRDHRHEAHATGLVDEDTGVAVFELADDRPNAEQHLLAAGQQQLRQRRIRAAITALPERQRTAVILNKYQGLEYEQVGEVLQLSSSATKSLLFRAYQTLRQELKDLL
ncbi:MAG: RNA polymerase sigma factor [Terriglobales bacterium]